MPITILGTGSLTGLSAGGLPDATVTTADIVDANVTAAKLSGAQSGSAPIYGCRAWCTFNGTTVGTNAPTAGGNVTNVTRNGTGDYTVNFTTAMPDANYAVVATGNTNVTSGGANFFNSPAYQATTTSAVRVATFNQAGSNTDMQFVSVAIFR